MRVLKKHVSLFNMEATNSPAKQLSFECVASALTLFAMIRVDSANRDAVNDFIDNTYTRVRRWDTEGVLLKIIMQTREPEFLGETPFNACMDLISELTNHISSHDGKNIDAKLAFLFPLQYWLTLAELSEEEKRKGAFAVRVAIDTAEAKNSSWKEFYNDRQEIVNNIMG